MKPAEAAAAQDLKVETEVWTTGVDISYPSISWQINSTSSWCMLMQWYAMSVISMQIVSRNRWVMLSACIFLWFSMNFLSVSEVSIVRQPWGSRRPQHGVWLRSYRLCPRQSCAGTAGTFRNSLAKRCLLFYVGFPWVWVIFGSQTHNKPCFPMTLMDFGIFWLWKSQQMYLYMIRSPNDLLNHTED